MKKSCLVTGLLAISLQTHAMTPVGDAAVVTQLVEQLKQLRREYSLLRDTYNNAKSQLSNAKSQLDELKSLKNFNSGHYGFGSINDSASDLLEREWSPNSWNDALNNVAGGNPARYKELVRAYEKNHTVLDDGAYEKGTSHEQLGLYRQNVAVNKAVSVESTYAYNDINKHLKAIHALSAKIETAKNTKAAVDLNSRLLAEIAYIEAQNLKLQSLISQQIAQNAASEIAEDTRRARFNRLQDE